MNNVNITGRLTKDPEIRKTQNGTSVASFTLACRRRFKAQEGQPDADFIRCVAWGKTAELIGNYVKKGSQIGVNGRIQTGSYEGKDGKRVFTTDVVVENLDFLDSKNSNQGVQQGQPMPQQPDNSGYYPDKPNLDISADDLPF